MSVFSIHDSRTSFWQWDLDQRLIVEDETCCEVHFDNIMTECALVSKVYSQDGKRLVDVPNILLQTAEPLYVYAYAKSDEGERTTHCEVFTVLEKPKPDDYVYTETEVWTAEKAVADALQEAKESGDFDGEDGTSILYCNVTWPLAPDGGIVWDDSEPLPSEKFNATPKVNDLFITSLGEVWLIEDISVINDRAKIKCSFVADLNGYTPVRGTDYWTDADKAEIKTYVDEAILGGAW